MQLVLRGLCVSLGVVPILRDIDLEIPQGAMVGLIGPNGAGKSTLFAALSGFAQVTAGSMIFEDRDLLPLTTARRAQAGLVRTFQVPREFASLSVRENLKVGMPDQPGESLWRLFADWRGVAQGEARLGEKVDEILELIGLTHLADQSASRLSGGQKKLLELGRAALLAPKMLVLDEPFNGINPVMIERLSRAIRSLNDRGTTMLLVEHNIAALLQLTDRLHVMDRGTIIAEGAASEVMRDERVVSAYLGNRKHHHA